MRARERDALAMICAVALAACATNPDPRRRPVDLVQRDGHGGWIVVVRIPDVELRGELISVEPDRVHVLAGTLLLSIARRDIASATVWAWDTEEANPGAWGALGSLTTISQGYFLIFTFPAWLVTTLLTASVESRASQLSYPSDGWDKLAIWARLPQGLPAGVTGSDLVLDRRPRLPPPAAPVTPPPPATPATPAAPPTPDPE